MNEKELYATMSVVADPINNVYRLNSRQDVEEIQRLITKLGSSSEKVINDCLHKQGGETLQKYLTMFMPRSDRNKVHAKDSKWWVQTNYNLAVAISNKTTGTKGKNNFYYLFYPATATGTSKYVTGDTFMEEGLEHAKYEIIYDLEQTLIKNINKELK